MLGYRSSLEGGVPGGEEGGGAGEGWDGGMCFLTADFSYHM